MDFADFVDGLRRYWRVVAVGTGIGALIGGTLSLAASSEQEPRFVTTLSAVALTPAGQEALARQVFEASQYAASFDLLVETTPSGSPRTETVSAVLESQLLQAAISEAVGIPVDELESRLTFSTDSESALLRLRVLGPDPFDAVSTGERVIAQLPSALQGVYIAGAPGFTVLETSIEEPLSSQETSPELRVPGPNSVILSILEQDPFAFQQPSEVVVSLFDAARLSQLADNLAPVVKPDQMLTDVSVAAAPVGDTVGLVSGDPLQSIEITAIGDSQEEADRFASETAKFLSERVNQLDSGYQQGESPLHVLGETSTEITQSSPGIDRGVLNIILGLLTGAGGALFFVLLKVYGDKTIRRPEHLAANTTLLPIGVIPNPASGSAVTPNQLVREPSVVDSYRHLRSRVLLGNPDTRVFCVTSSAMGGDEKAVALNLAAAIVLLGRSVVVVDVSREGLCDKHARKEYVVEGKEDRLLSASILNLVSEGIGGESDSQTTSSTKPLDPEFLGSVEFAGIVDVLCNQFDYVFLAAGVEWREPSAVLAASYAGGTLLVVRLSRSSMLDVFRAVGDLERVKAVMLGLVVVGASDRDIPRWSALPPRASQSSQDA